MSNQSIKLRVRDGRRHSRREGNKRADYVGGDVFKGTERELARFGDKLEQAGNRATTTGPGGGSRNAGRSAAGSSGQTARSRRQGQGGSETASTGADSSQSGEEGATGAGDGDGAGDGQPGAGADSQ